MAPYNWLFRALDTILEYRRTGAALVTVMKRKDQTIRIPVILPKARQKSAECGLQHPMTAVPWLCLSLLPYTLYFFWNLKVVGCHLVSCRLE